MRESLAEARPSVLFLDHSCRDRWQTIARIRRRRIDLFRLSRRSEDDAERAVRCALTVADTVNRLELDEELRTGAGIATSMVVFDGPIEGGVSREISMVGEAPS